MDVNVTTAAHTDLNDGLRVILTDDGLLLAAPADVAVSRLLQGRRLMPPSIAVIVDESLYRHAYTCLSMRPKEATALRIDSALLDAMCALKDREGILLRRRLRYRSGLVESTGDRREGGAQAGRKPGSAPEPTVSWRVSVAVL